MTRTITILTSTAALFASTSASAWAQPVIPPIMSRAEQCLRDQADAAVHDEPDALAAASLLVNFVCAKEVEAAARFERNTVLVTHFNSMMKSFGTFPDQGQAARSGLPGAAFKTPELAGFALSVSPETGDIVYPPNRPGVEGPGIWAPITLQLVGDSARLTQDQDPVPADLRALAANLVMAERKKLTAARQRP